MVEAAQPITQDQPAAWQKKGSVTAQPGPNPARIAYLLSQYPARSHTFFLKEILGLRKRGLHIDVASINSPDRALEALPDEECIEAHRTFYVKQTGLLRTIVAVCSALVCEPRVVLRGLRAVKETRGLTSRQRAFWHFYLAEALLVGRWMRQRKLSHLHVHFGGAVASVGMLASIAWNFPFSLTIHGPEELLDPAGYQLAAKLKQASFVVCISEFCRSELRSLLPPQQWSKLAVVPLGVEADILSPASKQDDAKSKRPLRLVCVGRLVEAKGHSVLLHALQILATHGIAFDTVLIGTGPLEAELRHESEERGLASSVAFTSGLSHKETLEHVRSADIFVLASFAEGVPVALMEAMSLGVPCVSTTIAGIPELIENGRSGLLVPPGDFLALADVLETLANDPPFRARLAHAGRERVLAKYNLSLNLDLLANYLNQEVAVPLEAPQKGLDLRMDQA